MDAPETAADRIGLEELRQAVRSFADREIAPLAAEIDASDAFPRRLWPVLGTLGVLGPTPAPEDGGAGLRLPQPLLIMGGISRAPASVRVSFRAPPNPSVPNPWT